MMPDQPRCCFRDGDGQRCRQPARFEVRGASGHFEDYTHACALHVAFLTCEGDSVWPLEPEPASPA